MCDRVDLTDLDWLFLSAVLWDPMIQREAEAWIERRPQPLERGVLNELLHV